MYEDGHQCDDCIAKNHCLALNNIADKLDRGTAATIKLLIDIGIMPPEHLNTIPIDDFVALKKSGSSVPWFLISSGAILPVNDVPPHPLLSAAGVEGQPPFPSSILDLDTSQPSLPQR
jgi:hypothetical protein